MKRAKYKCPFEANQLVKFTNPDPCDKYPFRNGEIVVFLGEIKQMPGHCIVVNRKGVVLWGFHTSNFIEPTEDEI